MNEFLLPLLALLLDHAIELVGVAILVMGRPLIARAADWLRLRSDSEVRAYLDAGLVRAVEYGEAEAKRRLNGGSLTQADLPNVAAELARTYAKERLPDALKRFRVDEIGLNKMVRARLAKPLSQAPGSV